MTWDPSEPGRRAMSPAVYVQTNDSTENEVIAFSRADDGALAPLGRYATGGRGTGKRHLASAGSKPTSVTVSGALVYVLNNGTPNISGFHLTDGKLTALADSARPLSGADADPAQVSFTPGGGALIATERGTNSISTYVIDERGYAQGPATIKSSGQTPY